MVVVMGILWLGVELLLYQSVPSVIRWVGRICFGIAVGTAVSLFRAALSSEGWILAFTERGLWINLRSGYNRKVPRQPINAVFVAYDEVEWFHKTIETDIVPTGSKSERTRNTWLDIHLKDNEAEVDLLRQAAMRQNQAIRATRSYANYWPVQIPQNSRSLVRVNITPVWVTGLSIFARHAIQKDTVRLRLNSTETTQERIERFLQAGNTINATYLLRKEEGMTLLEAKDYIKQWQDEK